MLFSSRKNKVIKSYLMLLPKLMTKDYGRSSEYTALQVIKSIERYKLNAKYQAYAMAIHCSKKDFLWYFENEITDSKYKIIREEISKTYFDGFYFNSNDVSKLSIKFSGFKYIDPTGDEGDLVMSDGDGD